MLNSHGDVFRPENLSLLQRVFNRACTSIEPMPDDLARNELASKLFDLFQSGQRDEEFLFHKVTDKAA